jgi:hypothetical protein
MTATVDRLGQRYGMLTVLAAAPRPPDAVQSGAYWLCHCDCGNDVTIRGGNLRERASCGCLGKRRREQRSKYYAELRRRQRLQLAVSGIACGAVDSDWDE